MHLTLICKDRWVELSAHTRSLDLTGSWSDIHHLNLRLPTALCCSWNIHWQHAQEQNRFSLYVRQQAKLIFFFFFYLISWVIETFIAFKQKLRTFSTQLHTETPLYLKRSSIRDRPLFQVPSPDGFGCVLVQSLLVFRPACLFHLLGIKANPTLPVSPKRSPPQRPQSFHFEKY